jgi:hypothetical protein
MDPEMREKLPSEPSRKEEPSSRLVVNYGFPEPLLAPVRPMREIEREVILHALRHFEGNRTHVARALKLSIRTIRNKIKAYREQGLPVPESCRPARKDCQADRLMDETKPTAVMARGEGIASQLPAAIARSRFKAGCPRA